MKKAKVIVTTLNEFGEEVEKIIKQQEVFVIKMILKMNMVSQ